jgi:alanine racemase
VLNGVFEGSFAQILAHDLVPVVNSPAQAAFWTGNADGRPYALHVDTGMNRLGLTPEQAASHAQADAPRPRLLMSHFACADEPDHPLNARQIKIFEALRACFPGVEASLANSAGIHLGRPPTTISPGPASRFMAAKPARPAAEPMRPVVRAEARILRSARQGPARP